MSRRGSIMLVALTVWVAWPQGAASASTTKIADRFSRVAWTSWGSAPGGWSWQQVVTSGAPLRLSVDGARGVATAPTGVNKANLLVGPSSSRTMTASATFTVDVEPTTGTPNHWQVILRVSDLRTYYAMKVTPQPSGPALVEIFRAASGVFTTLAEGSASFPAVPGDAWRIVGRAATQNGSVALSMRAWPVGTPDPSRWTLTAADSDSARLLAGRAGVRLSFYSGPATMTVDDFTLQLG